MGAGAEELREATYLYGSYTTLERSICAIFRTGTITQAAILAARVGLLTNAPLTKADIMIGSSRVAPNRVVTTRNAASMRRLIKMRNPNTGWGRGRGRERRIGLVAGVLIEVVRINSFCCRGVQTRARWLPPVQDRRDRSFRTTTPASMISSRPGRLPSRHPERNLP